TTAILRKPPAMVPLYWAKYRTPAQEETGDSPTGENLLAYP
ncbi:MAG: hypothetical protein QOH69_2874, partial [Actinomycetota bacterium]|nr:hypothetical protein [Actinomycetota bacterium]